MTISTDYTWTATRDSIIKKALRRVGVTNPTAKDLSEAAKTLNMIVKEVQNYGAFFWEVTTETVNTVASTQDIALAADTESVEFVYVRDGDYDYPVNLINRFQEAEITDKSDEDRPREAVFVKSLTATDTRVLRLYPIPDEVYAVYYGKVRLLRDMDAANENPDFFVSWMNALSYGLAAELSDEYHLPMQERQRLDAKASAKFNAAKRHSKQPTDIEVVPGSFSRRSIQ